MKNLLIYCFALILSFPALSQEKLLSTKDTEIGIRNELSPKTLKNIQWRGKSDKFTYIQKDTLYEQSIKSSKPEKIISIEELNLLVSSIEQNKLIRFPDITWENENEFWFLTKKSWYAIKLPVKEIIASIQLPENSANFDVCYTKKLISCTVNNNIIVAGVGNKQIIITNDKNPDIVNGDIVSRNEFGIKSGLFWSPQGNYLAYYRKDNSKVKSYPLVDIFEREAEARFIKYPMAGMASEHVSLGIYSITDGNTIFIEKEDTVSEKYLTNITWAPDEKNIYIQVLNRQQNHMKLNKYAVKDGSFAKTLFEEKSPKYVEPQNPLMFLNKNHEQFVYQSRRDGYNHAYLYNTEGTLLKQITSGNWEITTIERIDDDDNLYYLSTEESPIEEHPYKISLVNGKKSKLSSNKGTYSLISNAKHGYCILKYSNSTTPQNIDITNSEGKLIRNVLMSPNPFIHYNMPQVTIGTLKSADGLTDLYYRLIKPTGFEPDKKYPVIVYVYGGPHTQLIANKWLSGARLWDYMMAQKGYIVFTLDNRGSLNRGLEFENAIFRQCGVAEMQDQMEGIKFLKQQNYVDTTRMGVHGWSYGGFMTISLMTNYPNAFKTGVAGGPVTDWKYYEVMYGERYMDTPQENPDGYKQTSLLDKAKNLKGKLLIIHGAQDPIVVWQQSLLFINQCIKNNIPVDYFVYPDAEHNVRGTDRVHLMDKITDYFLHNL